MIACAVIVSGCGSFQVVKGLFEFGASVADERADARTWLNDHVEPGQTVVGEFGTPYVGRSDIAQQEVGLLSELDLDDLRDGKSIGWCRRRRPPRGSSQTKRGGAGRRGLRTTLRRRVRVAPVSQLEHRGSGGASVSQMRSE